MKCGACGGGEHRVLRTDATDDKIVRVRECLDCRHRFKTAEVPETTLSRADEILDAFREVGRLVGEA